MHYITKETSSVTFVRILHSYMQECLEEDIFMLFSNGIENSNSARQFKTQLPNTHSPAQQP